MEGVTEAEYLFRAARWCRNFVVTATADLKAAGWEDIKEAQFTQSFRKLVDAWTTYRRVLGYLPDADWEGDGPTPGQVLADLEAPRRGFITALDAYRVQLLFVQRYLPDTGITGMP